MDKVNGVSILKLLGSIFLVIVGLWFIHALLYSSGFGMNVGFRGGYEGGHMNMNMGIGAGYGAAGTISVLLLFLIKVLFVLFIVGLVIGIAIAVKNYVFTGDDIQKIKSTFTGKKTVIIKEACVACSKELNDEWKVCPFCGNEKEIKNV
jgi:hypothetical protein